MSDELCLSSLHDALDDVKYATPTMSNCAALPSTDPLDSSVQRTIEPTMDKLPEPQQMDLMAAIANDVRRSGLDPSGDVVMSMFEDLAQEFTRMTPLLQTEENATQKHLGPISKLNSAADCAVWVAKSHMETDRAVGLVALGLTLKMRANVDVEAGAMQIKQTVALPCMVSFRNYVEAVHLVIEQMKRNDMAVLRERDYPNEINYWIDLKYRAIESGLSGYNHLMQLQTTSAVRALTKQTTPALHRIWRCYQMINCSMLPFIPQVIFPVLIADYYRCAMETLPPGLDRDKFAYKSYVHGEAIRFYRINGGFEFFMKICEPLRKQFNTAVELAEFGWVTYVLPFTGNNFEGDEKFVEYGLHPLHTKMISDMSFIHATLPSCAYQYLM